MKRIALCAGLAAAMAAGGCGKLMHFSFDDGIKGSGQSKSETRTVGKFDRIALTGSPNVRWQRGASVKVQATTDDNLLEHLATEVENGELRIYFKTNVSPRAETVVTVTSPNLAGASVTGSGDLNLKDVDAGAFRASITGSGDLAATGRAQSVDAEVTGSGDLDLSGLEAQSAKAGVTGSGDLRVWATRRLDARITGSGDIQYKGSPELAKSVRGSGDVSAIR